MTEVLKEQANSLPEEMQQQVESLQHGIAVLDLFSEEVRQEERRAVFLAKTRLGTETREAILQGPSYEGNEEKLDLARLRAQNAYGLKAIRRQAMYEHALFMGIEARIERGKVDVEDPSGWALLSREHGNWRAAFASKSRKEAREDHRRYLQEQISEITGEELPELPVLKSISVEDRAVLMVRALNTLAHRSMLSGLNVAIVDDKYKKDIYDRYKEGTGQVKRGSLNKFTRLCLDAQRDFWDANNLTEFANSGLEEEAVLRQVIQHWWDVFIARFDLSPNHGRLVKARDTLSHYIPEKRLSETKIKK